MNSELKDEIIITVERERNCVVTGVGLGIIRDLQSSGTGPVNGCSRWPGNI